MIKRIAVGLVAVAALLGLGSGVSWATGGHTAHTTPAQVRCNADWTQNPDETSRKPVQKPGGMLFSGSALVHHKVTGLTVEHLHPGSYVAFPKPDQDSFFSVEVYGDGGKYGTLRWNTTAHYWEATSQGQQHHDVSAVALADSFPMHLSHAVATFGVGYTANPPGTVPTLVKFVKFNHHLYWLGCKPPYHHPSPRPCVTKTVTPLHTTGREHWCKPTYTHSPTPTPTTTVPTPPVTVPTKPGEAPVPTPVNSDLPVTG